jgi:hypothetical protein
VDCSLRINRYRKDYPIGFIVDLLTMPERFDVANALVADAIQYFDEHDVNLVVAMVAKHHPHEGLLSRFGFLDTRMRLHTFYWVDGLEQEMDALKKISGGKIHFSYGDIDSLPTDIPNANA